MGKPVFIIPFMTRVIWIVGFLKEIKSVRIENEIKCSLQFPACYLYSYFRNRGHVQVSTYECNNEYNSYVIICNVGYRRFGVFMWGQI